MDSSAFLKQWDGVDTTGEARIHTHYFLSDYSQISHTDTMRLSRETEWPELSNDVTS